MQRNAEGIAQNRGLSWSSKARLFLGRPVVWLSLLLIFILAYLALVPLIQMVLASLRWDEGDVRLSRDAQPGAFTFFHWTRVLKSPLSSFMFFEPLSNTLVVAIGATLVALVLGITLAWLLERSDLPGNKLLSWLAPIPYMMPSWYLALAWIVLFKNDRIGGATGLLQGIIGVEPPNWISYGPIQAIAHIIGKGAMADLRPCGAILSGGGGHALHSPGLAIPDEDRRQL